MCSPPKTVAASESLRVDADARWRAVSARSRDSDGSFVYAVRTTGVYCRPSCPSRTARRENVEFFDDPAGARAAGYRACRRCHPDDASADAPRRAAVLRACAALEASEAGIPLARLAEAAGMSPHHFHRVFKDVTGVTPKAYFDALRTRRVQDALHAGTSVTQALHDAGFNSASRFYDGAGACLGMSPRRYREGGRGEQIRYTVEPCVLGHLLVAATPRGVCAIEFGDSAQALVEGLKARFPKAVLEADDPAFRGWVGEMLRFIEHPRGLPALPLDVRGTAFQRRVWEALRTIPSGRTLTYTEVAESIGAPGSVRAVARAIATNEVAVAIPCHRAIRRDGGLAGYRWGLERKAALLRREREEAHAETGPARARRS